MVHEDTATVALLLMGAVKLLIAVLGAVITYYALKTYRRTKDRGFGFLAAGFGLVTFGAVVGGLSFEFLGVDLAVGVLLEGIFVLIGLVLIALSLRPP